MWDGHIHIGTRGGQLFTLGDPSLAAAGATRTSEVTTLSTTDTAAYEDN